MSSTSPSPATPKPEAPGHPADASDQVDVTTPGGGVEEGPQGDGAHPIGTMGVANIGSASNIGVNPGPGTGLPNPQSGPEKGPQAMPKPTPARSFNRGSDKF